MYNKTLLQIFNEFGIQDGKVNLDLFVSHIELSQLNDTIRCFSMNISTESIISDQFGEVLCEIFRKEEIKTEDVQLIYMLKIQKEFFKEFHRRIIIDIHCCVDNKEVIEYFDRYYHL